MENEYKIPISQEDGDKLHKKIDEALLEFKKKHGTEAEKYKAKFNPVLSNELQKKEPEPFPYLLEGLVPERAITLIAGDTGCGKSLFVLKIADTISRGASLFGQFKTKKTKTLYIDLEMNEEDYIYRTRVLCEPENGVFISYGTRLKIDDPMNLTVLKEFIFKEGIGLVVFDTLSKIHSSGDENDNSKMTHVMELLLELIEELKITVILIHHHNKNQERTGMGKGRGASAIADNCASYLEVRSKTIKNDFGEDILSMDIEQHKRRRSSIGKFGINIQFFENDKALFVFRSELNNIDDALDSVKIAVIDFIKKNPGLSKNKIKGALEKNGIKGGLVLSAIDVLERLRQIEIKQGDRRAMCCFIRPEIEQLPLSSVEF